MDVLPGDAVLTIAARNADNGDPVAVTITAPDGSSTDYTLAPGSGELSSATLPAALDDPLRVEVLPGLYHVQFDHEVVPFDVSVAATDTESIDPSAVPSGGGRLFSTDWRFFGGATAEANAVDADYFVRVPVGDGEYLWRLGLEGFAGGHSCIVANELGLPGSLSRSSQTLATVEAELGATADRFDRCADLAEFRLYVSEPNGLLPEPAEPTLEFFAAGSCGTVLEGGGGGEFSFESNLPATFEIIVDTDRDGSFDPLSTDAVIAGLAVQGSNIVAWDGRDGTSVSLPASDEPYDARISLRQGEFHFTGMDIETANPGVRISRVDTLSLEATPTLMYWDDCAIVGNGTDNPPDPATTIPEGLISDEFTHNWGDFSNDGNDGVSNNTFIDTWVYGAEVSDTTQVVVVDPDADADSDGLTNGRECQIGSAYQDVDTDGDGVDDGTEASQTGPVQDTDGDAIPDVLDVDDDGDGVLTADENPDQNEDGSVADAQDTDNDGVADYLDRDDDGDGLLTIDEDVDENGVVTNDDTDSDGSANYLDSDDDGDGLSTSQEIADAEEAGVADGDSDGDGAPNWLDVDSDGDGLPDATEADGDGDSNSDGIPDYLAPNSTGSVDGEDTDGDSVPNAVECPTDSNCADTDDDGSPDYLDVDDDGDGVPTATERPDGEDVDTDDDGSPDHLNVDDDGDGVPTATERPDSDDVNADDNATDDAAVVHAASVEGGGFGCTVAPNRGTSSGALGALSALLTAGILLGRRRRNAGSKRGRASQSTVAAAPNSKRGSRHWTQAAFVSGVAVAAALSAPSVAQAQSAVEGIALNQFNPSERGSDWFWGESLDLRGHNRWAIGVIGDWALKPLVACDAEGDEVRAPVRHQVYGHVGASVVLWERLRLGAVGSPTPSNPGPARRHS